MHKTKPDTIKSPSSSSNDKRQKSPGWLRAVKFALLTLMAVVLLCFGILVGCVHLLTPEKLTPLVQGIANRTLNADVSIGRIELSLRHSAPFLDINVLDLSIVARDMKDLSPEKHRNVPQWADTLLSVERIHGGINIAHIVLNRITLNDVEIYKPAINIAVVGEDINNFNIFPQSSDSSESATMPHIEIRRFVFVDPKPFRYIDTENGAHATLLMHKIDLTGEHAPTYTVNFDSNLETPLLSMLNLSQLPIAFNGNIIWNQDNIYAFALRDFLFKIAIFSGELNTALDLDKNLVVEDFSLRINQFALSEAMKLVPDTLFASTGFNPADLETDMNVAFAVKLNAPFEANAAHVPPMTLSLDIPDCSATWKKVDLRNFALNVDADVPGDDIDGTVLNISRLNAAGSATEINISGRLTSLLTDPTFDGRIDGDIDLKMLPPIVAKFVEGSLKGHLTATANVKASSSMFSLNNFHKIRVDGDIDLDNFLYERYDTTTFVNLHHACFKFDSNNSIRREGLKLDNMLSATIDIDTASIVHSDLSMNLGKFRIAVGALNDGTAASGDTTIVIPMGGGIKLSSFNLITLTDSMVMRVRDVKGNLVMNRFRNRARVPEFNAFLNIDRISTGDPTTRLLISNSTMRFTTHMVERRRGLSSTAQRHVDAIADSLRQYAIDIPLDSIPTMAMREYRRKAHSHISTEIDNADNELIDWDTSRNLRRLLLNWDFNGSLTAKRARVFSYFFPLRNRMSNINLSFTNDSISFSNIEYKAGRSDFLVSGSVTNIKKALTSRRQPSPLRINFDLISDSIDVNQLARATFEGSSFAANAKARTKLADDDESNLEQFIEEHTTQPNDSASTLLIPVNIEAEMKIRANNVIYADMLLHNLSGSLLLYDGALSMNNLQASSDVGSVNLSALYSAPKATDMKFGFGLKVKDFNIANFLDLVPAIDSVMPLMRDFSGIINANIAATSAIDNHMNLIMPSLKANIDLQGDSLVIIDADTYNTLAKWLLFKDKNHNMIDHMSVQLVVDDNMLRVFPFVFDFDRYRLGVQGSNDLDMNFNYHIAVLKSPIPFKFGINFFGKPDKYKIRLGRARFNETDAVSRQQLIEQSRINLLDEIQGVFRRGVRKADFADLNIAARPVAEQIDLSADTITHADSLMFIREGLIPAPDTIPAVVNNPAKGTKSKKQKRK